MTEPRFRGTGKFVWYDLMTPDVDASRQYYGELLGWTTHEWPMGDGRTYHMIRAGDLDVGGMLTHGESHPSHWLAYVLVDSVDRAAEQVTSNGGAVVVSPTDIPDVGRFAVIRDPQGAHIMPFTSSVPGDDETAALRGPGTFVWNELLTSDPAAAAAFYRPLFGWDVREMDMGPAGTYSIFARAGHDVAGMMKMPPGATAPPNWLPYIGSADVDATAARVKQLGGTILVPPTDIPTVGRFTVTADVTGAAIAFYKPAA